MLVAADLGDEGLREQRDQARRWAMHLEAREAALAEVVGALTHEYGACALIGVTRCSDECHKPDDYGYCARRRDHPVHRTLSVIDRELDGPEGTP